MVKTAKIWGDWNVAVPKPNYNLTGVIISLKNSHFMSASVSDLTPGYLERPNTPTMEKIVLKLGRTPPIKGLRMLSDKSEAYSWDSPIFPQLSS